MEIDKSKFEGLIELVTEMETQDNRMTMRPVMIELQKMEKIYTAAERNYTHEATALEELGQDCLDEYGIDPEEKIYWVENWVGVAWFFTYSGYEDHMRLNRHNYTRWPMRTYVQPIAWRNPEIDKIYGWLKELKSALQKPEVVPPEPMKDENGITNGSI